MSDALHEGAAADAASGIEPVSGPVADTPSNKTVLDAKFDYPRDKVDEDAPAVVWHGRTFSALAVFDGMGGSGARVVNGTEGPHSSAWYAARLASSAVTDELRIAEASFESPDALGAGLSRAIAQALSQANRDAPASTSVIRGSSIRNYPTTAALIVFSRLCDPLSVLALWAGDSRCYTLSPESGLQQLSRDDSRTGVDPMAAIREESPLSHMLTADGPCTLRLKQIDVPLPVVLLVATDGAFGNLPSPMHFEQALIDALASAEADGDWGVALAASIGQRPSDDISIAASFIGWSNWAEVAAAFAPRRAVLAAMLEPWDAAQAEARQLADEAGRKRKQADETLQALWNDYSAGYMAYQSAPP